MNKLKTTYILLVVFISFQINAQHQPETVVLMDPNKSIIKNAQNSGNHEFLLAAVKASDLETILDSSGPFTVFAPNDVNFDSGTKEKVIELVRVNNKEELQLLLGYHIIAGNLSASKILKALCRGKGKTKFTTITGDTLIATMSGLDIILTDKNGNQSVITKADSDQCNGVIHEIDSITKPIKV
ncbi:MAG: fasciclin domain-containing protein [Cellulophaga sp.]|nr:fasciclin domain-containing protein [Cellulophaga sp.]